MDITFDKIIENGINLFFDIKKDLAELCCLNFDVNDIKNKRVYVERIAKFGWTNCYDIMAMYEETDFNNQEEVDNYLFQKFTEGGCDTILDLMVDIISPYLKIEKELYEAKQCYINKEYRACALVITSLIDKLLILEQKEFSEDNSIIKTGLGASKIILGKIGDYNIEETGEGLYLSLISIATFLNIFFERTNNFENDKRIINRNMLMHGMWTNDITQIDCMKLFLALVNVVMTIDMYLAIKL